MVRAEVVVDKKKGGGGEGDGGDLLDGEATCCAHDLPNIFHCLVVVDGVVGGDSGGGWR